MTDAGSPRDLALTWTGTAAAGFADAARYLESIPESEWEGPSGADEWTIRKLAGHIAGEAVWYPNLVRGVTRNEEPYPGSLYEEINALPPSEVVARISSAAEELLPTVEDAGDDQLEFPVDMGFAHMPLWRSTVISAMEGVLHNWDAKARREPRPCVPDEWALPLTEPLTEFAPNLVHRSKVAGAAGTYLLHISGGFGPTTIVARHGRVSVERGEIGIPDVTLHLTPDQYIRLLAGRLKSAGEVDELAVEGDSQRVPDLLQIFGGIANGD